MIAVSAHNTMKNAKFHVAPPPAERERFNLWQRQQEAAAKARMQRLIAMGEAAERAAQHKAEVGFRHTVIGIERRICRATGLSRIELRSNRRRRDIVMARQAVMYWAYRLTTCSLPEIGRILGGRDHTTCLHATRVYPQKRAAMGRYLKPPR